MYYLHTNITLVIYVHSFIECSAPYAEEIIGDYQCEFRHNKSTIDHIFCTLQILKKKWKYNEAVHHLFIDFKKAYDSVRRKV